MSADPPDLDSSEARVEAPATIFVSDPSAEADRLSTALREKGYDVIDVPLALLVARVAVQMPSLVLLDVDAEGALDEVARLRAIPGTEGIDILFLGDPGGTLTRSRDALERDGSGFLPRPVDVETLLQKMALLIDARRAEVGAAAGASTRNAAAQERMAPSSSPAKRSPPPERWSERAGSRPAAEDALEPGFGAGASSAPKLPLPALSPEIERLLQRAEDRSRELGAPSQSPSSEPPSPDEELDAVLPAEVLAVLDEPLDESDDDLESDGGSSTSIPKKLTSSGPGATTTGGPPDESAGNGSTGPPSRGPVLPMESAAPPSRLSSLLPRDLGDPKEMETPRPPRRSLRSAPPMPNVPQPPPPPREFVQSAQPRAPARRSRRTSPPPPLLEPPLPAAAPPEAEARAISTLPPRYTTSPAETFGSQLGTDPPLPATPRGRGLARRNEATSLADPPRDSVRDSGVGVAPADLPEELGLGDALQAFAISVRERATGALCIDTPEGVRRILLRDGDVVTAASGIDDESLVAFLGTRGDIARDVAAQLQGKIPAFGRHAGAALVANGHISQDQLWPVLRAHAEWILSCVVGAERGTASFEVSPPGRLRAEPSVFGGATGSEVLIEVVRRSVPIESALARLGGADARLTEGPRWNLLSECALPEADQAWLARAIGATLGKALVGTRNMDLVPVVYALIQLGVLAVDAVSTRGHKRRAAELAPFDLIDAQALRAQVKARLSLVEEGDYFSLLGVARTATSYEVHRAYLELRHGLEPNRVLNVATADLADDIELIIEVLDEAHEILRDHARRERYRRAIEDKPP